MKQLNNNSLSFENEFKSKSCQVGSLNGIVSMIKEQLEFESFEWKYKPQAEEICLIVSEVMILPTDTKIQIAGNKLFAGIVQGVYSMLRKDHIELVMKNFWNVTYEIRHKKTYLRTALYNSVFELGSHYINSTKADFGI